jgi:hypothetical protein
MTTAAPILTLNEKSRQGVLKLISASHADPMDFSATLPWESGVDTALLPKPADQSWIHGTRYWDMLTADQQHELLWKENARDVSMFITLEQTIPPLYMGYINKHGSSLTPEVYEYLMLFSKEEIVHTLVFKRYMQMAGLPQFQPAAGLYELLTVQLPDMDPVAGVIVTLLIEWVAELAAMHTSQLEEVEPMTRAMFYRHHVDEARHIAFGRWIGESFFENAPPEAATKMRMLMKGVMARLLPQFTYNPEIARYTSFAFPIAMDDAAAIEEVRNSEANKALNEKRLAPIFSWLKKLEVM